MQTHLLLILLLATTSSFAGQLKKMNGNSMLPAIAKGDLLDITFTNALPARGDIIEYQGVQFAEGRYSFISRVVGQAGDAVEISKGTLLINGKPTDYKPTPGTKDYKVIRVPRDNFFVIGDNRDHSNDSRYQGPIPLSALTGKIDKVVHPAPEFLNDPAPPDCLNLHEPVKNLDAVYAWLEHSETAHPILQKLQSARSTGKLKLAPLDSVAYAKLPNRKGHFAAAFYSPTAHTIFIKQSDEIGRFGMIFLHEAVHAVDLNMELSGLPTQGMPMSEINSQEEFTGSLTHRADDQGF